MRIRTLGLTAVFFLALLCSSCGPSIYLAQDFRSYAPNHKTVAILPASVSIGMRPNQARNTSGEQMLRMQQQSALDFQYRIYSWLLRRQQQQHYTVTFQDVALTNSMLRQANLTDVDMRTLSPKDLANALGVDAVLTTSVRTSKPMSDGAAVALGVLVGAWGNTNQANITVDIHEGGAGALLWKYDFVAAGSVGSSPETIVNALMRNASRKFPYTPPKS
ncbi:hypothetical protein [Hymenobacter nivis]|uniref:DUF4136 domain-containing protein n=1 Tax=Hymenobacter nivis TaxID=1850093 RepID=A0A502GRM9_9BACT|nr:hypothetical protein [Hymenobacter nivis]TPG63573.1 hypothetical protein EAH73_16055 [Hymenobacter nivis]